MMKAVPAAAQDASPAAAPSGEPIKIGAPYNLTGGYASIDNPARQRLEAGGQGDQRGRRRAGTTARDLRRGREERHPDDHVGHQEAGRGGRRQRPGGLDRHLVHAGRRAGGPGRRLPFIDVGGTAPLITTVGDYIFMLPFGDNVQAAVSAEFAKEKGWKTAALLFDEAMDYTKFLAKYFKDRFTMEDIGGQIVSEQTYSMGDTDFSAQLTEFKNLDPQPDFLFVSSNPGEIGTIIKQARDLGLEPADRRWRRLRHAAAGRAGRQRGRKQRLLHDPPGYLRGRSSRGSLCQGLRSRIRQPAGSGLRRARLRRHQAHGRRDDPCRHASMVRPCATRWRRRKVSRV